MRASPLLFPSPQTFATMGVSRVGLAPTSLLGGGSLSRCVCFSTTGTWMDGAGREPASPTPYGAASGTGASNQAAILAHQRRRRPTPLGSADQSPTARPCRPATAFDFRRHLARGRAHA